MVQWDHVAMGSSRLVLSILAWYCLDRPAGSLDRLDRWIDDGDQPPLPSCCLLLHVSRVPNMHKQNQRIDNRRQEQNEKQSRKKADKTNGAPLVALFPVQWCK